MVSGVKHRIALGLGGLPGDFLDGELGGAITFLLIVRSSKFQQIVCIREIVVFQTGAFFTSVGGHIKIHACSLPFIYCG